jgi:hypothetical protein
LNAPTASGRLWRVSRRSLLLTGVTLVFCVVAQVAATADQSAIQSCGSVEDPQARLRCYDDVAKETRAVEAASAEETLSQAPVEQAQPAEEEGDVTTAVVIRCEQGPDGKYFFFFSNGQVWKQVKAGRERYKECDFNVTITRDWFGYKMLREGEQRRIRISLVK